MKITEDFERINEIKDLARRNMLGITPEDSDYIVENITDVFHAVYFVFDEWAKMKSALMILGSIPTDHPTEKVCTGKRCPMQVGYDVKNCKDKDCIYRTETEKGGVDE